MTTVGKIMVFVQLGLSLLLGGLAIFVYAARLNWADAYAKQKAQLDAARANRDQIIQDATEEIARQQKSLGDLQRKYAQLEAEWKTAVADANKLRDDLKVEQAKVTKSGAGVSKTQAALSAREAEVKQITAERDAARVELLKEIKARNEAVSKMRGYEAENEVFKARLEQVDRQLRELTIALARAKSPTTGATLTPRKRGQDNPPDDNIEGRIRSIDPSSGLITLTIGSDAGLREGHTLKVFRFASIPEQSKYLGQIEILSVRPHEAIARPVGRGLLQPARTGDRVASRIQVGG